MRKNLMLWAAVVLLAMPTLTFSAELEPAARKSTTARGRDPVAAVRGEYLYDHFDSKRYDWVPGMRYSIMDLSLHTLRGAVTYRFFAPR